MKPRIMLALQLSGKEGISIMQRKLSMCVCVLFVLVLLAAICSAQTQTARLVGTVKDATGAVVPNAKVSAVRNDTKTVTNTTCNPSGDIVSPPDRKSVV